MSENHAKHAPEERRSQPRKADERWSTALTSIAPNAIMVRGYHLDELMGRLSFADAVYLLLMGEVPLQDMHGHDCTVLADALGLRHVGERYSTHRYYLSLNADGWAAPIPRYLPYDEWAGANAIIDAAAKAAGRDPAEVVRIAQIVGTITDGPGDTDTTRGDAPLRGSPDQWAAFFARLATEQPFRTFVFWPERHELTQITRFAADVVPATKALLS